MAKKMNKFDFEAAKAGAPVCTMDGKAVRLICFDKKSTTYPIIGLVSIEVDCSWTGDGAYIIGKTSKNDLMMVDIDKDDKSCVSDEFIEKLAEKIVEKIPQFPWWVQTPTPNNPLGDCVMYGTGIASYDYTINPTISTSSAKINDGEKEAKKRK